MKAKGIKGKDYYFSWTSCAEDKSHTRGLYLRAMKTKDRARQVVSWWKEEEKFWGEEVKRLKKLI